MTDEMNKKVQKSLGFHAKEMMIFPCKRISKNGQRECLANIFDVQLSV